MEPVTVDKLKPPIGKAAVSALTKPYAFQPDTFTPGKSTTGDAAFWKSFNADLFLDFGQNLEKVHATPNWENGVSQPTLDFLKTPSPPRTSSPIFLDFDDMSSSFSRDKRKLRTRKTRRSEMEEAPLPAAKRRALDLQHIHPVPRPQRTALTPPKLAELPPELVSSNIFKDLTLNGGATSALGATNQAPQLKPAPQVISRDNIELPTTPYKPLKILRKCVGYERPREPSIWPVPANPECTSDLDQTQRAWEGLSQFPFVKLMQDKILHMKLLTTDDFMLLLKDEKFNRLSKSIAIQKAEPAEPPSSVFLKALKDLDENLY